MTHHDSIKLQKNLFIQRAYLLETASEKSHPKPKEDSEPAASEANVNAPHTKASGDSGAVSEEFALEAQSKNLTENGSGVHGCQNENSSSSGQYVADPYGLSSMLKIVRMNDLNINVMVGTDIKSLGFDLNEREYVKRAGVLSRGLDV